jgi:hypothetical protein
LISSQPKCRTCTKPLVAVETLARQWYYRRLKTHGLDAVAKTLLGWHGIDEARRMRAGVPYQDKYDRTHGYGPRVHSDRRQITKKAVLTAYRYRSYSPAIRYVTVTKTRAAR